MFPVYTVHELITTVTTGKTLLYIETHATRPIQILSASVTCTDEDTAEQIAVELNRIATLGTPTATTRVPKPTSELFNTYGGVVKVNVTADEPVYDAYLDAIAAGGANKLGGWYYDPKPEELTVVSAANDVGLRLVDTIISSSINVAITFAEIG